MTNGVVVIHDITQTSKLSKQLAHQATHDALTDLINRYEFGNRLSSLIEHISDEHVLCYIDLNQFKVVNDTSGG